MFEIPFEKLVLGKRYKFLWGPYDILLSGVCTVNVNRNVIADFNNSTNEDGTVANDNGLTASAGPFFNFNSDTDADADTGTLNPNN